MVRHHCEEMADAIAGLARHFSPQLRVAAPPKQKEPKPGETAELPLILGGSAKGRPAA